MIARAVADLAVMQSRIAEVLLELIQHPITGFVFLIYLFYMNYRLTLVVFLAAPVIVGLVRLFGRKVKKHARRVQDTTAEVTSAYQETLQNLKVVQGFGAGDFEVSRFRTLAEQLYSRIMRWRRWELGVGPGMDAAVFLIGPAFLIFAKVYFDHSLGELLSILYAFSRLYAPVKKLGRVVSSLRTLQGATERVFAVMHTSPDIADRHEAKPLPRHCKTVRFDHVHFAYESGEPVLEDVSFEAKAGEMVAFVGATGGGKSTLLDLIPRFYDVTGGSVVIDGVDVRDVTLDSLRPQIGIVHQDILLFHDTIAGNIRYGRQGAAAEEIVSAARAAHAHEFIMAQPKGYDTVIGDRGALLSGGQRQRIAIARALLVNPAILILDEAASALDSESEKQVQKAIESLMGGPTIFVVAHRLSTILKANRIFVLEGGKMVESGTKQELLAAGGRFHKFYHLQFGAEAQGGP
jgi:subfamily B ATP-binding cassette protein MsbA